MSNFEDKGAPYTVQEHVGDPWGWTPVGVFNNMKIDKNKACRIADKHAKADPGTHYRVIDCEGHEVYATYAVHADAPAPDERAAGDAYGDKYADLERFNTELEKLHSAKTWYTHPVSKMYLDAIEWRDEARDAHKVMDAQKAQIDQLRQQLAAATERAERAEAALEAIALDPFEHRAWFEYCKTNGLEPQLVTREQLENGVSAWEVSYRQIAQYALAAKAQADGKGE